MIKPAPPPWLEDDAAHCWHPFTQAQTASPPLPIVGGQAEFLIDPTGKRYFDAASSWWVNLHGHNHSHIAKAIATQAQTLAHTLFAGIAHQPAAQLAKRLATLAPFGLERVFYSDNGSTAVEVALKMAFQYWHNLGARGQGPNKTSPSQTNKLHKTRLIALQGGYHGDTFGAMSAGHSSGFYEPFKPWLFAVDCIEMGLCPASEARSLAQLDALLQHAQDYAAIVLEPLVQGAAGMRMARPEHVATLCQRCHAAGVLVILDEVFTGFGRTGTVFAAHQLAAHGGHADLLCLSKGLTGGFLPMGATLAHPRIYAAFLGPETHQAFLHGHSYTANPLACAAALASLDLLEAPSTQASWQRITNIHQHWQAQLLQHPALENPRVCGTIAAFELKCTHGAYGSATSQWLRQAFMQRGILVRPLGNTLYWVPPYCTQSKTLNHAYQQLLDVLKDCPKQATSHPSTPTASELF